MFIDEHEERFGVEPIRRLLSEHGCKIAPSAYFAFKTRAPSARAVRVAELVEHSQRVFWDRQKGRGISGARKMWRLLKREGTGVPRCTVERLAWSWPAARRRRPTAWIGPRRDRWLSRTEANRAGPCLVTQPPKNEPKAPRHCGGG
jgi:putative transposase